MSERVTAYITSNLGNTISDSDSRYSLFTFAVAPLRERFQAEADQITVPMTVDSQDLGRLS